MIHVESEYAGGKYTLLAVGHAGTAPEGQDLVCAAVSVLVQTAAEILHQAQETGEAIGGCCYIEKGDTVLTGYELSGATLLKLNGVELGFALMAREFPEAVSFGKLK